MTIYSCEKCVFSTNNLSNYKTHEKSLKHNSQTTPNFFCKKCEKSFKTSTGRWLHNKNCVFIQPVQFADLRTKNDAYKLINRIAEQHNKYVIETERKMNASLQKKTHVNIQYLNKYYRDNEDIDVFVKFVNFGKMHFQTTFVVGYIPTKRNLLCEIYGTFDKFKKPLYFVKNAEFPKGLIYIKYNGTWIEETPKKHPILKEMIVEFNHREMEYWVKLYRLNCEETHGGELENSCDVLYKKEQPMSPQMKLLYKRAEFLVNENEFKKIIKSYYKINGILVSKFLEKIVITEIPVVDFPPFHVQNADVGSVNDLQRYEHEGGLGVGEFETNIKRATQMVT